jgi:surfeit locus 1 family protein
MAMLVRLRAAGLIGPLLMTAVGLAILLSLGIWQLQRKAWKDDLIAKLAERAVAPAVSLKEAVTRFNSGQDIEYLRIAARGRFLHDKERYFYAPDPELGPGVNVYTPMEISGGSVLFVNRGFIPDPLKDPTKRAAGLLAGDVDITGLARRPGDQARFVPDNDTKANLWYWRDLGGMLVSAFETADRPHVPFFVEAEVSATPPSGWPKGGATLAKLSNRHLEYAITWFGLAATLLVIFGVFARSRLKARGD